MKSCVFCQCHECSRASGGSSGCNTSLKVILRGQRRVRKTQMWLFTLYLIHLRSYVGRSFRVDSPIGNAPTYHNCTSGDLSLIPGLRSFGDLVPLSPPCTFLSNMAYVICIKGLKDLEKKCWRFLLDATLACFMSIVIVNKELWKNIC